MSREEVDVHVNVFANIHIWNDIFSINRYIFERSCLEVTGTKLCVVNVC